MVPLHLALEAAGDSARGFALMLRMRALGVVRLRRELHLGPRSRAAAPAAATPDPPTAAAPRAGSRLHRRARELVLRLEVLERVVAGGGLRIARPTGWLVLGCADPAATGILFGHACAVAALLDPGGAVALAPLWTFEDRVAGELTAEVRIVPLRVLAAVLAAVLASAVRARGAARSAAERTRHAA